MTLDLAKIKSDAEIIASRCDTLLMPLPVKDVLGMLSELEKFDDGMRALAFQLSAGGYNAETLTADQLVSKVSDGLKAFVDSTGVLVDALRKDKTRLDRLDSECESYGTHYHEGNRWVIDGPFATVRDAIDAALDEVRP